MRFKLPTTAFLIALFSLSCQTSSKKSGLRIIGGTESSDFPAIGILASGGEMLCTATLIGTRRILTAAHCLEGDLSAYSFHVGADFSASTAYKVRSLRAHPDYDAIESNFDIALGELEDDVPLEPLPLAERLDSSRIGQELLLIGYGRNEAPALGGEGGAGIKRRASSRVKELNASKLKAELSGISSCNGDSGGPALMRNARGAWEVVGVVSCGDINCKSYGVYTRVDVFSQFIAGGAQRDPPLDIDRCESTSARGACQGNLLRKCSNDCFAASMVSEDCSLKPGGSCHRYEKGGRGAVCIDASWKPVIFHIREATIKNGQYELSSGIEADIFFGLNAIEAGQLAHGSSDGSGRVSELLPPGDVPVIVRRFYSSRGIATSRPRTIPIASGEAGPIELHFGRIPVEILVEADAAAGEALYITGQGKILGDWKEAYRLRRLAASNGGKANWSYHDALPMGIAYKIVKAKDRGMQIDVAAGVQWEQGDNHILKQPMVIDLLKDTIQPRF